MSEMNGLLHPPKCLGTLRDKITKYDAIICHDNIVELLNLDIMII